MMFFPVGLPTQFTGESASVYILIHARPMARFSLEIKKNAINSLSCALELVYPI